MHHHYVQVTGRSLDTRVFDFNLSHLERYQKKYHEYPRCHACKQPFYTRNVVFSVPSGPSKSNWFCINCAIIQGLLSIKDYRCMVAGLEKQNRLKPDTINKLLEIGILDQRTACRLEKYMEQMVIVQPV